MLSLALALLLLPATLEPTPTRKTTLCLSDAVDYSTFICIGTVDRVDTVSLPVNWTGQDEHSSNGTGYGDIAPTEVEFGRIVVERVLMGDPTTQVVYHEAWSSWMCDTTSAHEGQRCLFFLLPGEISRAVPSVGTFLNKRLGAGPILRSVGSGDGIVRILQTDSGVDFVRFDAAPDEYRLQDPADSNRDRLQLSKFVEHIETLAKFAPERIAVRATSRQDGPRSGFDYRILADGSTCFAVNARSPLRVSKLTEASWSTLQSSLVLALGAERTEFGEENTYYPFRSLHIALPGTQLSFTDDDNVIVSGMSDAEFARYRSTIEAWKLVRATMDCADCVDHADRDAELLRSR